MLWPFHLGEKFETELEMSNIKLTIFTQISGLQDYAYYANLQTRASLHRPSVYRLHAEEQLQRVGPPHALLGHGCPHLLQLVLLRRKGGAGHGLLEHPGIFLVIKLCLMWLISFIHIVKWTIWNSKYLYVSCSQSKKSSVKRKNDLR